MAASPFILLLALATLAVLAILAVLLITKLVQGVTWVLAHIGHFVIGELTDALRVVGALLAWTALIPLILGCVVIGRWSAAAHFSRSWLSELGAIWTGLWRIAVAHPLNLLLLTPCVAVGRPDIGLLAVAAWTLASIAIQLVRIAQAGRLALSGQSIRPYAAAPGPREGA